ncbi:FixH family protein [Alterinioella nitratireducens]|jgi:nitrogen fixation protein FixH|uniref:FixH family protein n=1 Tax=Alterinioella nitratireducens TaxID=2735915 RepID=UPI001554B630|nr:FixH family protein [Alterinioella nitratireducens]NPD19857.1 FixH family protein [Alterinioella nitratireducens]
MSDEEKRPRELTGRKVLLIFVLGFGLIIGVNLFMAFQAVRTFPGLEVSSSYADSQDFDIRREAQEALGWTAEVEVDVEEGILTLHLLEADGSPALPAELVALLTRPTSRVDDQELELTRERGALTAPVDIAPGRWRLRLTGTARDGTDYRHNITFTIRE